MVCIKALMKRPSKVCVLTHRYCALDSLTYEAFAVQVHDYRKCQVMPVAHSYGSLQGTSPDASCPVIPF